LPDYNGWTTEKWWTEDTIIWNGDDYVLVNYGKIKAKLISSIGGNSLRALYRDSNNTYLLTMNKKSGDAVLTQQQIPLWGGIMTRTAALKCDFISINAD